MIAEASKSVWPTFTANVDDARSISCAPHTLVDAAIGLLLRQPNLPALEILGRAIAEHPYEGFDFASVDPRSRRCPNPAYPDELYPPSPFAELLRRAFDPTMDPRDALLLRLDPEHADASLAARMAAIGERWTASVIEPFFARLADNG